MPAKPRPIALVRHESAQGYALQTWTCHTEEQITQRLQTIRDLWASCESVGGTLYDGNKLVIGRITWNDA